MSRNRPSYLQRLFGALLCGVLTSTAVRGEDLSVESVPERPSRRPNLKLKTFGGVQFWTDVHFFHDWHIQQHVLTKHYRLLDGEDVRHCWGTLEECKSALNEIREKQGLPKMSGKGVILIHGISRSAKSMETIKKRLVDDDYAAWGFNYASMRMDIPAAAEYLHQVIESLEGVEQIDFVVHSMGGLVVRAYLAKHRDRRIGRMVMLGVPNLGARLASQLKQNWIFKSVWGPAGQQLAKDPGGFIDALPTPDFEFAVIAGSRGTLNGYNPLVPGDDDGTVAVESTKLPGATDFITVRRLHSFMVSAPDVLDLTERFLTEGHLREKGDAHPLPLEKDDETRTAGR